MSQRIRVWSDPVWSSLTDLIKGSESQNKNLLQDLKQQRGKQKGTAAEKGDSISLILENRET